MTRSKNERRLRTLKNRNRSLRRPLHLPTSTRMNAYNSPWNLYASSKIDIAVVASNQATSSETNAASNLSAPTTVSLNERARQTSPDTNDGASSVAHYVTRSSRTVRKRTIWEAQSESEETSFSAVQDNKRAKRSCNKSTVQMVTEAASTSTKEAKSSTSEAKAAPNPTKSSRTVSDDGTQKAPQ